MKDTINVNCPVAATLQLIGGKYKALLLWHLSGKILRFNELRRLVPEATPKMLTQQLRELEGDGLIARKVYAVVPPKVESAGRKPLSYSAGHVRLGQQAFRGRRHLPGMLHEACGSRTLLLPR